MEKQEEIKQNYVIDARQLWKEVGGLKKEADGSFTIPYALENQKRFDEMFQTIKVVARSNPEDKLMITVGLQNMKGPDSLNCKT